MTILGSAVAATASVTTTMSAVDTSTGIASAVTSTLPGMIASALPSAVTTTQPVTASVIQVPVVLEITASFAGALAGALAGVRMRFDLVGIATLAVVSGLGGGIIRDVLLQKYGVYALENPRLLVAALTAAFIGFFFYSMAERLKWALFLVDAVALGLFAAIGSDKALLAGLTIIPAILLGTMSAVGGGLLRDQLTGVVPQVLRPGGYYATVAVAGSLMYVLMADWLHVVKTLAIVLTVLVVLGLRLLTYVLGWETPTAFDLTPLVAAAPKRVVTSSGRAFGRAMSMARRGGTRKSETGDALAPDREAETDSQRNERGA